MADEPTALKTLADAVQAFANEDEGNASVVLGVVVVYEVTRFEDNGDQTYRITYTIPSETSMAAALGLLDAGLHMVRADAIDGEDDE